MRNSQAHGHLPIKVGLYFDTVETRTREVGMCIRKMTPAVNRASGVALELLATLLLPPNLAHGRWK